MEKERNNTIEVCCDKDNAKSDYQKSSENQSKTDEENEIATQETKIPDTEKKSETGNICDPKNVHYERDVAVYTDTNSGCQYQWDKDKNEWVLRSNIVYGYEDDTHVYTDAEGIKFFWDKEKKAWFPKLDDDFMAVYQMNYGFTNNVTKEITSGDGQSNINKIEGDITDDSIKAKAEKRKASEPSWFEVDETQNTKVYVSNLPLDIDEQEFVDLMQKCGLVMRDPTTGDALCSYIRVESVELALKLLDGYDFKGKKLKVERAKFQLKGEYDPKLKPKMRKRKEKMKLKKQQEKLFDWRPEKKAGEKTKHERVVIVKNLFEPDIFDRDVGLILEFQQDLREEAGKIGEVRKVVIYDRHPEGVAQITMGNPEEAEQVVSMINGRFFMKRQLQAEVWDGKTKYKIAETDSQITQRLEGWDKFLEGEEIENKNEDKPGGEIK
ncbi:HIV Tat-specific factor 1 isoform X2 [Cylas formicarius]|uniref:HIV Tat-specific factor 1 isoform X2 n=1 Tax=Cylas formicarius TaxID=197179 RepID=UPI002958491C|nr:HIV Tat-specific factor 1 isoform X2 [Cylas formicarius]